MGTVDLCFDCGPPSYLLAASLTAVAFVLWKTGTWMVRPSARGMRALWWALALVVWIMAAVVAHAAWVTLG